MAAEREGDAPGRERGTACYLYGVVPADVETDPEARGVGDPPGRVTVIRHGDIAALVSEIARDKPLGTPEDLQAHEALLDAAAAEVPVLPLRFGAAMSDPDAVAEEFLAPHHDDFAAALKELEGRAEYVVKGRYVQQAVLREVLAESPEAARLRERISGTEDDAATRNDRIALGELVNRAIARKRDEDTRTLVEALSPLGATVNVREPTHEEDAAHVALLVETARQPELVDTVREIAERWRGRVTMRLLGPLAAYDFVIARRPEG